MSGFAERLSNLPPGVTDADIERQAGGDGRKDGLSLVNANTIPESWKVLDDAGLFVAQFANKSDAFAFLALARIKRWDNGEWENWHLRAVRNPTDSELTAYAESAWLMHWALCEFCVSDNASCADGRLLEKQARSLGGRQL